MKSDKEVSRLKRQLETERSENTRLQERLRAKDNELDTAEARIVEFKKSESTAQSEILLAKQRIGVLESLASTTSEELLGTLARVEREKANLAGSLKHANDRIKTLIEDRHPIREARDTLKTQLTEMDQKFDALSREHGKMKDARNRLSERYKELLDDKRALEARVETHNGIKDELEEDKKGLGRVMDDLQLKLEKSENLVLRVRAEKKEIEARLDELGDRVMRLTEEKDAVYQSRESLQGKLDYLTQEIDRLNNGIVGKKGEETLTLKELFQYCDKVGLEFNKMKRRHERLKLKYKEKVEDGPLCFKDSTSGQLMTNEQLFELHQKCVQDHKTLEQRHTGLLKRYTDLVLSDFKRKKQDTEQYKALGEKYNEAKEKGEKAEKDLAEAVRRHYRATHAMREEKGRGDTEEK